MKHIVSVLFMFAAGAYAQPAAPAKSPQPTAPVPLRRVPPPNPPKEPIPLPEQYPFTNLVQILQNGDRVPAPGTSDVGPPSPGGREVPKEFRPDKDIPLAPSAREAVRVSEAWMLSRQSPAEGKDGRVIYTYGAGLPTVVCAPLRVCVVELQPGEKIVGEPHIGDSVRWVVAPATAGKTELAVPIIVLKPKSPGLDTNLLVTTDRRAYYLRLVSKPDEYLARVAFAYPDDEEAKWKAYLAKEEELRRRRDAEAAHIAPVDRLDNLYFDYKIYGGTDTMRPIRVVDDGKKTYIQMTAEAAHRELPMLAIVGADGKAELVNYRVKGAMYVVDRLFDRGALILGTGRKAAKADIIRGSYSGKKPRGDPYKSLMPNSREGGGK